MDNNLRYGIRWSRAMNGCDPPDPLEAFIVTGQNFAINGVGNVRLRPGDPITRLASGGVNLCDGSEGASGGVAMLGIVAEIERYYDATQGVMVRNFSLPSGVAYSTNLTRQTKILYYPVEWGVWEIDASSALASLAAAQLLAGANCDHTLTGTTVGGYAYPRLNVASTGTGTAQWRIEGTSLTEENQDFTGNYVKFYVRAVEGQGPLYTATGI